MASQQRSSLKITWKATAKQKLAWNYLQDKTTTEIFYGGGAGGGKTYLGCVWVASSCLRYPGARYMLGREELKNLKATTLLTFFEILRSWGLKSDNDYKYNSTDGTIKFYNGSEVYLRELKHDPSDPEFDKLGSTEYTGIFIDECSQISTKAKNIAMSRIRYKLIEFGLVPKLLMCSNPTKNFLYYEFYKPWKEKMLAPYRVFIPALVQDNIYISPHYIENLKKLDKVSKERLLFGNFEYDDDLSKLFKYDNIINIFSNRFVYKQTEQRYMSVDVARFGGDKTIIYIWRGLYIEKIIVYEKKDTQFIKNEIIRLCNEYNIPRSYVVIDEDGIGGGVVDALPGVRGFVNGSKAYETKTVKKEESKNTQIYNYANLKAQCYFKAADLVELNKIGCYEDIPVEYKSMLIEDLEQIKRENPDKDGKLMVTPKEKIKEILGRSPDFGDALMMRMLFIVATSPALSFGSLNMGNKVSGSWSISAQKI